MDDLHPNTTLRVGTCCPYSQFRRMCRTLNLAVNSQRCTDKAKLATTCKLQNRWIDHCALLTRCRSHAHDIAELSIRPRTRDPATTAWTPCYDGHGQLFMRGIRANHGPRLTYLVSVVQYVDWNTVSVGHLLLACSMVSARQHGILCKRPVEGIIQRIGDTICSSEMLNGKQ